MTRPKLPLPPLRFVIVTRTGMELYRLIPQTTRKGRVIQGMWAVPGGKIMYTDELKALCRSSGWRYRLEGEGSLQLTASGRPADRGIRLRAITQSR